MLEVKDDFHECLSRKSDGSLDPPHRYPRAAETMEIRLPMGATAPFGSRIDLQGRPAAAVDTLATGSNGVPGMVEAPSWNYRPMVSVGWSKRHATSRQGCRTGRSPGPKGGCRSGRKGTNSPAAWRLITRPMRLVDQDITTRYLTQV